jgi:phosphotriesterase-related protein
MRIQTVLGPIDPMSLGPTMMHEHTFFDVEVAPGAYDAVVSDADLLASELARYGAVAGSGGTIVDLTTDTIGRNPRGMAEISRRSGVSIVMGAGWYRREYHPLSLAATWTNSLADLLVQEFQEGVPGSGGIRPGILGELGTGRGPAMTPGEERAFRAAARAQRVVGFSISTHTTHYGELAFEQIALLREEGVPVERIVIGHVGELQRADDVLAIAETGVFVQVDHVGRRGGGMIDDRQRARNVAQLVRAGRAGQVTLSMDICANSQMEARGGHGYAHLLRAFVPMLREEGVGEDALHLMLVENPRRILAF